MDQAQSLGVLGEWRHDLSNGIQRLNRMSNNYTLQEKIIRDNFKDYFNREGFVSWQWERVNRTN